MLKIEPNNDRAKPQWLKSSTGIVNGRLEKSGDVDTYAVTLKKGQTVVASMEANRTLASPMDAVLQIVSSGGFVLEQNDDDHGLDPQIAFTAPADGDYLVRTFAFPATANSTIGFAGAATFVYRLTVTTGGFVDFALPLAVPKGENRPLRLVGWNLPESANALPTGKVATEVFRISDPEFANTLTLPTVNHPSIVEQGPPDRAGPQDITLPVTVTGRIEQPRDIDAFRFTAKRDNDYGSRPNRDRLVTRWTRICLCVTRKARHSSRTTIPAKTAMRC